MACTRRRYFTGGRLGKRKQLWSWQPWNGCRGLTTSACSDRSETSHRLKLKKDTIDNLQYRLRNLFYFNQTASAIPGSIHAADPVRPGQALLTDTALMRLKDLQPIRLGGSITWANARESMTEEPIALFAVILRHPQVQHH